MNEKIFTENEVPKYKKKSKARGQPRSKHKHEYKTVLLHTSVEHPFDKGKIIEHLTASKVCTICGRINGIDCEQYKENNTEHSFLHITEKQIKNPETLENWCCEGYLAKFAHRKEE